jgi:hypothetical protein
MLNRLSSLTLLVALVLGYALAGVPARADEAPRRLPNTINRGDKVTLTFKYASLTSGSASIGCTIAETQDGWVRCAPADEFNPSRDQRWYDLKHVIQVTKAER